MTPTPDMIAMAERIADTTGPTRDGVWTASYFAALTAIMEEREAAAGYLQKNATKRSDRMKIEAIRNGEHLR